MFTAATVPVIVDRRVAAVSALLAWLSVLSLSFTWAFADASCVLVVVLLSSRSERLDSEAVRSARAAATSASSDAASMVASTSPLVTLSPTFTSTLVTVPLLVKARSACCFGSRVPVLPTVVCTV